MNQKYQNLIGIACMYPALYISPLLALEKERSNNDNKAYNDIDSVL